MYSCPIFKTNLLITITLVRPLKNFGKVKQKKNYSQSLNFKNLTCFLHITPSSSLSTIQLYIFAHSMAAELVMNQFHQILPFINLP